MARADKVRCESTAATRKREGKKMEWKEELTARLRAWLEIVKKAR
jgi:hypothetical protein